MSGKKRSAVSTDEIVELQFQIQRAATLVQSMVQCEDAVILVGNTKVGKSSLINYLMGNRLKAVRGQRFKYHLMKDDDSCGPEIGLEPISKTDQPRRFKSDIFGIVLYDVPGFCDNRGKWTDILNGVYVCELLKHFTAAKIFLIVSWDDLINDDIALLLRSFKGLENLVGDKMKECFANIGLIISKVDEREPISKQDIANLLKEQLLSNDNLDVSPIIKDFISYLINNQQSIGTFKRPSTENVNTDDINFCIISAINSVSNTPQDILKEVTPNISEASEAFLYTLREQLFDQDKFIHLQELVSSYLKGKYMPAKDIAIQTINETRQFSEKLTILKYKVEEYLTKCPRFGDKMDALRNFDQSIGGFIDANDLYQKVKCIEIIDQLLKNVESRYLDVHLQCIFTEAKKDIENNLVAIDLRVGNITKEQADQKLQEVAKDYAAEISKLKNQIERLLTELENRPKPKKGCTIL